ncbi:MAG: lysophospholipase, partial [Verrucomicrobia bacterium]|nr:lysophospholipase [Verrucomicrobiota bacterium]
KSKQRMLCDTWLTHIGHLRPGMAKGLTLDAAKTKSIEMDSQIESLLK